MSNSSLANSAAIQAIQNDMVDALLAGNTNENIAVAAAVAGAYGFFFFVSLGEFAWYRLSHYLVLAFFCAVRVVALSTRAYMQKHLSTNLVIVYETFFAFGFVLLVKLLCILLTAWNSPTGVPLKRSITSFGVLRSQNTITDRFISIILFAAQVIVIIGSTEMYAGDATVKEYNKGLSLLKAGYTIFLVAIGLYDLSVITGPILNRVTFGKPSSVKKATLTVLSLLVLGLLLTCKAVFQVIAVYTNPSLTFRNNLFYPLEVAPELLVVLILCIPGYIRYVIRGSHAADVEDSEKAKPAATPLSAADPEAPAAASPEGTITTAPRETGTA